MPISDAKLDYIEWKVNNIVRKTGLLLIIILKD